MSDSQEIRQVFRSKDSARVTYDRMSRFNDLVGGISERHFTGLDLKMLDVQPGDYILEIGFGTGHSLVALAQGVTRAGTVTGVDLTEGMLRIARSRLQRSCLLERVTLHLGDAASHLFGMNRFDAVFTSFTLVLFDTPESPNVLQESFRVLYTEGRIGAVALARNTGSAVRIYERLQARFPAYVDCHPIYSRHYRRGVIYSDKYVKNSRVGLAHRDRRCP